jgi:hypothetical protein
MTSKTGGGAMGAGIFAMAGFVLAGCVDTGRIYVSTPQVNTRERLVARRAVESESLRRQLTNSDSITTTFQGVEGFREFSGFPPEHSALYRFPSVTPFAS